MRPKAKRKFLSRPGKVDHDFRPGRRLLCLRLGPIIAKPPAGGAVAVSEDCLGHARAGRFLQTIAKIRPMTSFDEGSFRVWLS
jgi:hypothetical protein